MCLEYVCVAHRHQRELFPSTYFFIHLSSFLLGTKKVRSTSIGGTTTLESIKKTLQTPTTNDQSPTETMSMIITMSYYLTIYIYMYMYINIVVAGSGISPQAPRNVFEVYTCSMCSEIASASF